MTTAIRTLDAAECRHRIGELSSILIACVADGASVSFMAPLSQARADAFWAATTDAVAAGGKILLVAEQGGRLVGTVTLVIDLPENQPHRGDIAKMLVHPDCRRQGIGRDLLLAAETAARNLGRSLLVLDTVADGAGEALYRSLGWVRVGQVPDYALLPHGGLIDTVFYYRKLA